MSTSSPSETAAARTAAARTAAARDSHAPHADEMVAPPPVPSETELAEAWFDAAPVSSRRPSSVPPPPVSAVGEFLGDPLADAWLR